MLVLLLTCGTQYSICVSAIHRYTNIYTTVSSKFSSTLWFSKQNPVHISNLTSYNPTRWRAFSTFWVWANDYLAFSKQWFIPCFDDTFLFYFRDNESDLGKSWCQTPGCGFTLWQPESFWWTFFSIFIMIKSFKVFQNLKLWWWVHI